MFIMLLLKLFFHYYCKNQIVQLEKPVNDDTRGPAPIVHPSVLYSVFRHVHYYSNIIPNMTILGIWYRMCKQHVIQCSEFLAIFRRFAFGVCVAYEDVLQVLGSFSKQLESASQLGFLRRCMLTWVCTAACKRVNTTNESKHSKNIPVTFQKEGKNPDILCWCSDHSQTRV